MVTLNGYGYFFPPTRRQDRGTGVLESLTLSSFSKMILYFLRFQNHLNFPRIKQSMNTKRAVKLIKRDERIPRQRRGEIQIAAGPNKWSRSVRSWVVEFQEKDRSETLPAFDSLFRDPLFETAHAD